MVRALFRKVVKSMGYEVIKAPRAGDAASYELVHPLATYSPWNEDAEFIQVTEQIAGHTLVDTYRCFELWQLVRQVESLDAGDILEVGVWRGGTGAVMAKRAQLLGSQSKLFLCDTFEGVVKAGANDSHYKNREHSDTSKETVEGLLSRVGVANAEILVGIFPEATASRVADRRFRLCHVDVDVYQSAKDVVDWVWPRLVPGGIVVFDDYGFSGCDGVTRYVNESMGASDRHVLHNLNGHALFVKRG